MGGSLFQISHREVANSQEPRNPQLLAYPRQTPELKWSSLKSAQSGRSDRPISLFFLTRVRQALARGQPPV